MVENKVLHIGPLVPVMAVDKFAAEIGATKTWVQEEIRKGRIPTMPKKGREDTLINVALYWQIALSQAY